MKLQTNNKRQMKHLLTILLLSLLSSGVVEAQSSILGRKTYDRGIKSHTFIPKGQWMLGTTFSYSEHEDGNYKFLVLEDIKTTGYTFKVSPFFGYFIRDNVALGGRFAYNRSFTDLGNISLDIDEDLNFSISDMKYLEHNFSATGFVRTYLPIGNSKVFGLFNEARATYGFGQGKNSSGVDKDYSATYQTINSLEIGMSPGLTAFITNYAAVEVSVGVLGFKAKWVDQETDKIETGTRRTSSANFKIDLFSINLGMNFYF